MKYKHIIWDWNGTLLDDLWLSIKAINIVLKKHGLPVITSRKYLDIFTFPVIDYYRKLGFDFNKTPFVEVGTEFIVEYTLRQFEPELHPGAKKLMNQLERHGVEQSLLSAAKQGMLEILMDHHNITNFEHVVGQDNHYAYGKEDAGKRLVKKLNLNITDIVMIGDTLHDLSVADELGIKCVFVSLGHTSKEKLLDTGVSVFSDFYKLSNWFFNSN